MVMAGRQLCLAPSVHTLTNTHPCSPRKGGAEGGAGRVWILLSLYPSLSYLFLNTFRDISPFSIHLVPIPIFLVSQKTFQVRTIGLWILNTNLQYLPPNHDLPNH